MILNYHYSINKNSQGSRLGIHKNAWASLCINTRVSSKTLGIYIPIRSMLNGKSYHVARAAYHCALALSNNEMLNKVNKNNTEPLVKAMVETSLDHDKGVVQYKTTIFKHISNQRFLGKEFYRPFIEATDNTSIVQWEPHVLTDVRVLNELPVLKEYLDTFNRDNKIAWILATLDNRAANFPFQKQSHQDFWVMLLTKADRAMGLEIKCIYQDEKSGMDIIKHSTKGSIGLLTYDNNGNNIQVTNKPITLQDIINFNKDRVNMITQTLDNNGIKIFGPTLIKAKAICDSMQGKSYEEFSKLHTDLQFLLWKDLQCHPLFPRSLSFVFIKQIINTPQSSQEKIFSQEFRSHLDNRMYDLNKKQDFKDIYKAMIFAGYRIDPCFIKKLQYLHSNGYTLNNDIMSILAHLIKYGIS